MNRLAYLLLLLLISAQVDDYWVAASPSRSAPAADDDEYLPSPQRPQEVECSPHQKPTFAGLKRQTADFPLVRRGVPSQLSLITPFTPPPLYVLMSLQI
jgi:hypothetical protein